MSDVKNMITLGQQSVTKTRKIYQMKQVFDDFIIVFVRKDFSPKLPVCPLHFIYNI